MCACVSVCVMISPESHSRSLPIFCMLPIAVARSFFDRVTKWLGEGAVLGFSFHLQCIVQHGIWNPYKNSEPIEMPFGAMTRVGPRCHVLDDGPDLPRGRGNFRGFPGPFKSIDNLRCSSHCSVAAAFAAKMIIQSQITSCSRKNHSLCQASLKISGSRQCDLSAANWLVGLHSAGEV